jgi:chemotaxis protein methyltransferase CheR
MHAPELTPAAFLSIRQLIHSVAGISMSSEKEELVRSRLAARLRELKLQDYEQYLQRIRGDRVELSNMVDVLTTNKTSFFREPQHFKYLIERVFPVWRAEGTPRQIWSAGCSTGEEPYTLAMLLREHVPAVEARILATDLSLRVLRTAKRAHYTAESVAEIPPALRQKYLRQTRDDGGFDFLPELTGLVAFARLNLIGPWSMRGPFDLILCRNVMIYFDEQTRSLLARRFAELLAPDASLFIGHAESLASLHQPLRLVEPAIYRR